MCTNNKPVIKENHLIQFVGMLLKKWICILNIFIVIALLFIFLDSISRKYFNF